ncbi:MAG: peptidase M16-like protein [Myxococcales bacterium]|nr:peptidase M16-like protein [Myxococcales bacterium]
MLAIPLFATLLSFTSFKLDNGLTVLVHEDHTVPVVAVDVWYHVGSRDEVKGKTGFAHLFEHMMFQGSAHVADKQHFKYVQEAGGWGNGTTNTDRTNYFEVLPSSFLELGLWLEADRMGFLLATLTQEKLDNQRDVVRNEKRQNYDNRPYGLAPKAIFENLYPPEHPYHHLTIGEHEDLEQASLDDVKAFFKKYYAPSNASIAIAGDVDAATVKKLCEKYFGPLPSLPPPDRARKAPPQPVLKAEKRVQLEDRVTLERVYITWPSPPMFAPGDAELDLLAATLGSKSGRLYKRLVYEARLAQVVEVAQSSAPLSSQWEVVVTLKPGHTAAEVLPIVDEEIARARKEPLTALEIEKAKNEFESSFLYRLMSVGGFNGRADQLNMYAYYAGDPAFLDKDIERYRAVAADGIQSWAQKTLGPGRLVVTVSPKKKKESK